MIVPGFSRAVRVLTTGLTLKLDAPPLFGHDFFKTIHACDHALSAFRVAFFDDPVRATTKLSNPCARFRAVG